MERLVTLKLYDDIANKVAESIYESWIEALVTVYIEDDNANFVCRYINESSDNNQFKVDFDTYMLFDELRNIYKVTEKGPWDKAIFKLLPDGEFTIDFEYKENSES